MISASVNNPFGQKGMALLIFVIFMVFGAMAYFLSSLSLEEIKQHQIESTAKSLQRAKQALIAYAVTYGDIDGNADTKPDFPGEYGFLPCPDYNAGLAEGLEDNGNCGATGLSKVGFFPWKTLDLPVLKDDSGTCLLYAVTGEYKNDESATPNKTLMLNEDSNGMFQIVDEAGAVVRGANAEDRIVAIIFAPGKVLTLTGQNRTFLAGSICGQEYTKPEEYLDVGGVANNSDVSTTPNTIDKFIHATADSIADTNPNPYNDRFVTITRDEIWGAIVNRTDLIQKMTDMTEALAMCLRDYAAANGNDRLPWPVSTTLADYRDNINYDDNTDATPGYAGRYPFTVDSSNSAIPGANISNELFVEAGCNAIVVTSGATVDLQTTGSEYRVLWENWKDHFFYAVSQDYAPDVTPATCGTCITVDSTTRAAMVVFSGSRQTGEVRNEPLAGDIDTKFDVRNYIENVNATKFPDLTGNGLYTTATSNDIMYCLTTASPPAVVTC
jgi:hypothetical protein